MLVSRKEEKIKEGGAGLTLEEKAGEAEEQEPTWRWNTGRAIDISTCPGSFNTQKYKVLMEELSAVTKKIEKYLDIYFCFVVLTVIKKNKKTNYLKINKVSSWCTVLFRKGAGNLKKYKETMIFFFLNQTTTVTL